MSDDNMLDQQQLAGMLADMDRMIEASGCSYHDAVLFVSRIERLDMIEAIYLKLAYERRMAGEVH
jgi:hypothetical protein